MSIDSVQDFHLSRHSGALQQRPDEETLASGSWDTTIILWDVSNPNVPSQLATLQGHGNPVQSVAFNLDEETLASGGGDGTIILWDVRNPNTPSQLSTLQEHSDLVNSIAFSPDGETLASVSADSTIILWDIDPLSWIQKACQRAGRNFTRAE